MVAPAIVTRPGHLKLSVEKISLGQRRPGRNATHAILWARFSAQLHPSRTVNLHVSALRHWLRSSRGPSQDALKPYPLAFSATQASHRHETSRCAR
jgi:hypothetical protein